VDIKVISMPQCVIYGLLAPEVVLSEMALKHFVFCGNFRHAKKNSVHACFALLQKISVVNYSSMNERDIGTKTKVLQKLCLILADRIM